MKRKATVSASKQRLAHLLETVNLSRNQMASAKARMDQAEAIADGMIAVASAIRGAVMGTLHGSQVLARRIKSAFMKPAHH